MLFFNVSIVFEPHLCNVLRQKMHISLYTMKFAQSWLITVSSKIPMLAKSKISLCN